jgi:hypothetical protein
MTSEPVAGERLDPSVIAQAGAPVVAWKARAGTLALTATSISHGASLGQPESDVIGGNAEALARRVFLNPALIAPRPPDVDGQIDARPPTPEPPSPLEVEAADAAADVFAEEIDIIIVEL